MQIKVTLGSYLNTPHKVRTIYVGISNAQANSVIDAIRMLPDYLAGESIAIYENEEKVYEYLLPQQPAPSNLS